MFCEQRNYTLTRTTYTILLNLSIIEQNCFFYRKLLRNIFLLFTVRLIMIFCLLQISNDRHSKFSVPQFSATVLFANGRHIGTMAKTSESTKTGF